MDAEPEIYGHLFNLMLDWLYPRVALSHEVQMNLENWGYYWMDKVFSGYIPHWVSRQEHIKYWVESVGKYRRKMKVQRCK